jgi:hypothetical protein
MGEGRRRMERPLEVDVLGWMSISLYLTGNEEWVASSIGDSLSLSPVPGTRFLLSLEFRHPCLLADVSCLLFSAASQI